MTPLAFLQLLWQPKPEALYVLIWALAGKTSHWFRDVHAAADFVSRHRHDVYIGVGLSEQDNGPHHRCPSEKIAGIAGLWADFDLRSDAHSKKALPATAADALSLIPTDLPPTIIVSTGNGFHAWWLFREPWIFESDDHRNEAAALISRFQMLLHYNSSQRGWAFDQLADLARVLRIPGTVNGKDPNKPNDVEVYSTEGRRYDPSDVAEYLDRLIIADAGAEEHKAKAWITQFEDKAFVIDPNASIPEEMLSEWIEADMRFHNTWHRQRHDLRDNSQSGYDLALANFGVDQGLEAQQIVNLIMHNRRKNGAKRIESVDYFKRAISKARNRSDTKAPKSSGGPALLSRPGSAEGPIDGNASELNPTGVDPNAKAKLCDRISRLFGIQILRILKVTGKEPVFLMQLDNGIIEFADVGKLISQKAVRTALAARAGKIIPRFKPKAWEELAQMLLDACTIEPGSEDMELEGEARIYVAQYLSETQFIRSPAGQPIHSQRHPMIYEGIVALSATDLKTYINRTTMQSLSVKSVAAMLAALDCKAVRIRGQGYREQDRWALPIDEFDPADYPQPQEDDGRE